MIVIGEFIVCSPYSLKLYIKVSLRPSTPGYMNPGGAPLPMQQGFGMAGGTEIDPGSLGQMDSGGGAQTYGNSDGYGQAGFEDEPPLLQELGIDFELIKQKVCNNYRVTLIINIWYTTCLCIFILPFCSGKGHHQIVYNISYPATIIVIVVNTFSSASLVSICVGQQKHVVL